MAANKTVRQPTSALLWGALSGLGFVLTGSWKVRAAGALLALISARIVTHRVRWRTTLLTILTFLILHQLTPEGKILLTLGPLRLTQGALASGLDKGCLFVGLIYISRTAVRPPISLPGSWGAAVGLIFEGWEKISEQKFWIKGETTAARLDRLLLDLDQITVEPPRSPGPPARKRRGVWAVWTLCFWAEPIYNFVSLML